MRSGLTSGGSVLELDSFTYNRQGRLWLATLDKTGSGGGVTSTEHEYNDAGIRVSKTVDGTKTLFLVDSQNPTGYAQVLEELTASGQLIRSYTLGLDVISQFDPALAAANTVLELLYDGHGSTRALVDTAAAIAVVNSVTQIFHYNAYGNLLNLTPAQAATTLLYSGEQFDQQLAMQYLRARFYNPATGTFNRLDPFAGNMQDPQSLHKYLYVHGDPVQGVDPSGLFQFHAEMGKAAHAAISLMYAASPQHFVDVVTYGTALSGLSGALLPDVANYSRGTIAEIKPLSHYGITTGQPQLWTYLTVANGSYALNGPIVPHAGPQTWWIPDSWQPGVHVIYPGGFSAYSFGRWVVVTVGNFGGVIYYAKFYIPRTEILTQAAAELANAIELAVEPVLSGAYGALDEATEYILSHRLQVASVAALGATMGFAAYSAPAIGAAITATTTALTGTLNSMVSAVGFRTAIAGI